MSKVEPKWAKLYLIPRTDMSSVPEHVVGYLMMETADSYVLNPMLEPTQLPDASDLVYEPVGMNFINKQHVWRCQILEQMPEISIDDSTVYDGGGGLG